MKIRLYLVLMLSVLVFGCTSKSINNSAYIKDYSIVGIWTGVSPEDEIIIFDFDEKGNVIWKVESTKSKFSTKAKFTLSTNSSSPSHLDIYDFDMIQLKGFTFYGIVKFISKNEIMLYGTPSKNGDEVRPSKFESDSTVFKRITNISKPISVDKVDSRTILEIDSSSQFVAIDQHEPAFIIFTGIPKNLDEKKLEEIKLKVSSREKLTLLTWQQFLERVDEYARLVILKNDYPNIRIVDGLVCLVASKKGTGAPWGLTWNGGIALTRNDYKHARQTYESYKANPASYKPIRDPRADPVNPGGHLPFAGCN